jgi:hypothetical protein
MPTKKQRRRQQKSRRHEYEYVYVDDEGKEVQVESAELDAKKDERRGNARARAVSGGNNGHNRSRARTGQRAIQPPSWRRAFKRALVWGPVLVVAMMLLNRNVSPLQWITSAVFLIAFFVPISYFTDSIAYRMYRKRVDRQRAPKAGSS